MPKAAKPMLYIGGENNETPETIAFREFRKTLESMKNWEIREYYFKKSLMLLSIIFFKKSI